MSHRIFSFAIAMAALFAVSIALADEAPVYLSHPPIRPMPVASTRPMGDGPAYYVAPNGDNSNDGSKEKPWKTINFAMTRLQAGDTLYLRGGTYFENVYCAIAGTAEKPITFRSFPGEIAVLDGGIPEFENDPADAWEPVTVGGEGEYRSKKAYPNIRDVTGRFGDSLIGLQTYWHPEDLRTRNEVASGNGDDEETGRDVIYCGPGVWYNRDTSHIHVRLAPTHFDNRLISNYTGESDPRKLPIIITPFASVPLYLDLAQHIRFLDLVIRGGGLNTVRMNFGMDIDFDHVIIYAGTYGMRAKGSGPVQFTNSAIYGGIGPWTTYLENGLHIFSPTYTDPYSNGSGPTLHRNTERLAGHALMVLEGFEESDIFAYPFNNHWEIAYSEFADGSDGIYPDGNTMMIHDNWVGNMQDDAIYLSGPTRYVSDNMHLYRNYVTGCTTAFAMHGRSGPEGSIYLYANVVDTRYIGSGRMRTTNLKDVKPYGGNFFFMHGSSKMSSVESYYLFNNTAILWGDRPLFLGGAWGATSPASTRQAANNIFVYMGAYPGSDVVGPKDPAETKKIWIDGNLHWSPDKDAPADYLKKAQVYGWELHGSTGSPSFLRFNESPDATNDYRVGPGLAEGTAIPIPAAVEAKLQKGVIGRNIGAFQAGESVRRVGIDGRIIVGAPAR